MAANYQCLHGHETKGEIKNLQPNVVVAMGFQGIILKDN